MSNTNDTNAPGRLSLVELTKTFSNTASEVTAVDHINLDIHPGEFITLLGPSGCGKTTTLRMIAGFEEFKLFGSAKKLNEYFDDEDEK